MDIEVMAREAEEVFSACVGELKTAGQLPAGSVVVLGVLDQRGSGCEDRQGQRTGAGGGNCAGDDCRVREARVTCGVSML